MEQQIARSIQPLSRKRSAHSLHRDNCTIKKFRSVQQLAHEVEIPSLASDSLSESMSDEDGYFSAEGLGIDEELLCDSLLSLSTKSTQNINGKHLINFKY